jgi:hypothetical protein
VKCSVFNIAGSTSSLSNIKSVSAEAEEEDVAVELGPGVGGRIKKPPSLGSKCISTPNPESSNPTETRKLKGTMKKTFINFHLLFHQSRS